MRILQEGLIANCVILLGNVFLIALGNGLFGSGWLQGRGLIVTEVFCVAVVILGTLKSHIFSLWSKVVTEKTKFSGITVLLFAVLTCLIYSNTLSVPFYLDDFHNIGENDAVKINSLSGPILWRAITESPIITRPVANLSFALNYLTSGDSKQGFHIINILIHFLTGILLFFFLRKTISLAGPDVNMTSCGPAIAFWSSLLWLVHPLQTQSVTYIVQRMNSMAAMFYLAALLLYVYGRTITSASCRRMLLTGSCVMGLAALGSKEIAVTLPVIIFLYEWYFLQQLDMAWLKRKLPVLFGIVAVVTLFVFLVMDFKPMAYILNSYHFRNFTLMERLLTEPRVMLFYISLLFFPLPSRLSLDHDFLLSHTFFDPPTTVVAILFLAMLVWAAVRQARRRPLLSFSILWFILNLIVESSVLGLEIIFEHRLYLPSQFFFVPFVSLLFMRFPARQSKQLLLVVLTVLFCFWTYERNEVWADRVVFLTDVVNKAPMKSRPHSNLGEAFYELNRIDEAIPCLKTAILLDPTDVEALYNLGNAMLANKNFYAAITNYKAALRFSPGDPDIHNNLGYSLQSLGRYSEAIYHYRFALKLDPNHAQARFNLSKSSLFPRVPE